MININNIERLIDEFKKNPYLLRMGAKKIASRKKATEDEVYKAKEQFRRLSNQALYDHCEKIGVDPKKVKYYWHKSKKFSMNIEGSEKPSFEQLSTELLEQIKTYAPVYPVIPRVNNADAHLLVLDPADIHIGKLCSAFETGEDYNNQIAVTRVKEGVLGILNKVSGFQIDQILLVIGNDILHIDTPRRNTTSGTPQDTDGMWYDNFLIAQRLYTDIITSLLPIAPVHVQYDPSNHDYTNGFFLANTLKAWFSNTKDVTFNTNISHRKYYKYGQNLIGTTHGDGAKEQDLPLLMAQEAPQDWAVCKHRYFYTHHIHHKRSRDYGSVCIESLRSPSGTDSWHHRQGYVHSPKAVEGFLHHPVHGQIARFTNYF